MRNERQKDQLIRSDSYLTNLVNFTDKINKSKGEKLFRPDDCLAADYAYYILLIEQMRRCELQSLSFADMLANPVKALGNYTDTRAELIGEFVIRLYTATGDIKPNQIRYLRKCGSALRIRARRKVESFLKNGIHKYAAEEIFELLLHCLFHLPKKS